MQDAQTCIRLRLPLTRVWTVWMFGSHRRFVRRCEWLSCFEKYGDFPQISQVADMEVMVPVPAGGRPPFLPGALRGASGCRDARQNLRMSP